MNGKKMLCFACSAVFLMTAVTACGQSTSSSNDVSSSQAQVQSVTAKETYETAVADVPNNNLTETTAMGDSSSRGFDSYCLKLYGIELEKLSDGVISYASSGGLADEISIIRPGDGVTVNNLISVLNQRVQKRIQDFQGYKPEEVDKIEASEVFEANGFACLVIADNASDIKDAIIEASKQ